MINLSPVIAAIADMIGPQGVELLELRAYEHNYLPSPFKLIEILKRR